MMKIRSLGIVVVLLMTFFLSFGEAHAIPLTNTPITTAEAQALFDFGGLVSMWDTFDFPPTTTGDDGWIGSGYIPGIPGTLAEGYYLYFYGIEVFSTSSDPVSAITFDFKELYTGLDLNGDGLADTSLYCSDCGGVIPSGASYDLASDGIRFFFLDLDPLSPTFLDATLNPGDFSTVFGAISPAIPGVVTADLLDSGGTSLARVYAPVPEPGTLMLLGSGLFGVGVYSWRRIRKK